MLRFASRCTPSFSFNASSVPRNVSPSPAPPLQAELFVSTSASPPKLPSLPLLNPRAYHHRGAAATAVAAKPSVLRDSNGSAAGADSSGQQGVAATAACGGGVMMMTSPSGSAAAAVGTAASSNCSSGCSSSAASPAGCSRLGNGDDDDDDDDDGTPGRFRITPNRLERVARGNPLWGLPPSPPLARAVARLGADGGKEVNTVAAAAAGARGESNLYAAGEEVEGQAEDDDGSIDGDSGCGCGDRLLENILSPLKNKSAGAQLMGSIMQQGAAAGAGVVNMVASAARGESEAVAEEEADPCWRGGGGARRLGLLAALGAAVAVSAGILLGGQQQQQRRSGGQRLKGSTARPLPVLQQQAVQRFQMGSAAAVCWDNPRLTHG